MDVPRAAGVLRVHWPLKLGITPKRLPISLAPVLNRIARSAVAASSKAIAASYTPGPVSVCRPSIGTPKAAISSINALKKPRWSPMRSSE